MDDEQHRQALPAAPASNGWLFPAVALGLALVVAGAWAVLKPKTSAVPLPVPTSIPSDPTTSPPAFTGVESIGLNFDRGRSMPYQRARVEVRRHDYDLNVRVSLTSRTGTAAIALVEGRSTVGIPWTFTTPDNHLEFAAITGYVKNVASLNQGAIQVAYLANVGVSVLAIARNPAISATGFVWSDYAGAIRNSRNETIPSATVVTGEYSITVYEDAGLGIWGYFDGVVNVIEPIAREPVEKIRVVHSAESSDPSGFERLSWVGLLPVGATDPGMVADTSAKWGAALLGKTGKVVIAGYREVVDKLRTGVQLVTYTDASGQQRSFRP